MSMATTKPEFTTTVKDYRKLPVFDSLPYGPVKPMATHTKQKTLRPWRALQWLNEGDRIPNLFIYSATVIYCGTVLAINLGG